jgi:hypothetical protein
MPDLRLERRPLLLLATFFLFSLPVVTPYLRGDGIAYYAYLASVAIDGDLQFENEYRRSDPGRCARYFDAEGRPHASMRTSTGHLENYHSTGPALLWSPFFAAAHAIVKTRNALVGGEPIAEDGYSRPYLMLCALGTALFGFVALLLSHAIARREVGDWPALWATLGFWFASNLIVYMYLLPFLSHAASAFVNAAFVWLWWRSFSEPSAARPLMRSLPEWLLLGALGGLAFSTYYVSAVLGVFVLFDVAGLLRAWIRERTPAARMALRLLQIGVPGALGFALGAAPHWISRWILVGSPFVLGYDRLEWSFGEWVTETLFSSRRGLFLWHPIYLLACIGFVPLYRRSPALAVRGAASFLAALIAIASKPNWHGGSAFGNRYFLILLPVFVPALAACLESARERISLRAPRRSWLAGSVIVGALGLLTVWNAGFLFQWGANLIPNRGSISFREVAWNQVTEVPARLGSTLLPFVFERDAVVKKIEKEDLAEVETYEARPGICKPAGR